MTGDPAATTQISAQALIADVGGTNTRMALVDAAGTVRDSARFANDDHAGFAGVLAAYLGPRDLPPLDACCIAVAGPVTPGRARLTNRDWRFDPAAITAALPGGQAPVTLVNDLVALGQALPGLRPDQVSPLRDMAGPGNGQALVLGLGTGVNACPVTQRGGGLSVLEVELGHASLPASVFAALHQAVGAAAERFGSVEHLFSGRGLVQLHRARTGEDRPAAEIVAEAPETVALSGRLLGLLARELVFQYLPLGGLYFAGSVARGLLTGGAQGPLCDTFAADGPFADIVRQVSLRLITDDGAALTGLARLATA